MVGSCLSSSPFSYVDARCADQAVNTISEIWRPQDVPRVFLAPTKGSSLINVITSNPNTLPNQQLSSIKTKPLSPPTSPSTKPSPFPQATISQPLSAPVDPLMPSGDSENLLPMKTFVHEVLRRSRTSGNILQTALCYLEAIRSKVPEILQQERMGIRAHYQPDTLIQPATDAELLREVELAGLEETFVITDPDDPLKTVVSKDCDADFDAQDNFETDSAYSSCSLQVQPSESFALSSTTNSLPSPLLCPRRAFLASLILASKFFQDKCYSNRAWAKLSGLPPREIGRCERALGQALEWRLWVGKTSTSAPTSRTLARAQSESSIFMPANARTPPKNNFSMQCAPDTPQAPLRRCATLPEEILSGSSCEKNSKARQSYRKFVVGVPAPVIHAEACDANMEVQITDQPVSFTHHCANWISMSVPNARTLTLWNLSLTKAILRVQALRRPLLAIRPLPLIARRAIARFRCRPLRTPCSQVPTIRRHGQMNRDFRFQPSQLVKTWFTVPLVAFLSRRQVSTCSRHQLPSSNRNSAL